MSDIIPFPRSKDKLIRDIKMAYNQGDLEEMYSLFDNYEEHFELDETLSLLKCSMLYRMNHFLELREEAIILLKQGFTNYDELVIYYVESLNGLGQYFEAIEVIDQIIDEVQNHKTRMELLPLKSYALSQLEQHNAQVASQLQQFDTLEIRDQINTILTLIDNSQYCYKDTVASLLNNTDIRNNVISIMLEYLRFAQYEEVVHISKFNQNLSLVPKDLPGLEHTTMKQQVIPEVVKCLDDEGTQLLEEALHVMNNHAILLYPIDIQTIGSVPQWIKAYENYFKSMLGIVQPQSIDEVSEFIQRLDQLK